MRRAYRKGGKVEGSIWHERDSVNTGGDVEGYKDGGSPENDIVRQRLAAIPSIEHADPAMREKALGIAQKTHALTSDYEPNLGQSFYSFRTPTSPENVQATVNPIPGVNPLNPQKQTYEQFYKTAKGGTLVNLGGDRSRLGRLTHIHGQELAWPVDLHAGPQYMLEPNKGAVWANAAGQTTRNKRLIEDLQRKGPVYGVYSPMGPKSVDSSFQMSDALMSQLAKQKPEPEMVKKFDKELRAGLFEEPAKRDKAVEKMKEWPGLDDPWAARNFLKTLPGTTRSLIVKHMDKSGYHKAGFPHVGMTRVALTDPELLKTGGNMIGHRVVELTPQSIEASAFEHNTYPEITSGRYVADIPLVQRHYALPEAVKQFAEEPHKPGVLHPYSENPNARSGFKKMTEEQKLLQNIDEPWLESVLMGIKNQSKYGFKKGGRVAYKKGGKVEGSIWHEDDIGMGDEPVQPHALLHPEKDPGKVGVISSKVLEEANELPKMGTIHWHKPVVDQDDHVQRTIRHRLNDFTIEERNNFAAGGRAHFDEGGITEHESLNAVARGETERAETDAPAPSKNENNGKGDSFVDQAGQAASGLANMFGGFFVSPAEAREVYTPGAGPVNAPSQEARSFVGPHETLNAVLGSGKADIAPTGLTRGTATPEDTAKANAAEAAAEKMDIAFGPPLGVGTTFNTPPLPGGPFEPKRSATGTPLESILAAGQPTLPETPVPSTTDPLSTILNPPKPMPSLAVPAGGPPMPSTAVPVEPVKPVEPAAPVQTPEPEIPAQPVINPTLNVPLPTPRPDQPILNVPLPTPRPDQPILNVPLPTPRPDQAILGSTPQPMPTPGNVPLPPVNPAGYGEGNLLNNILKPFGLDSESWVSNKAKTYTNQGVSPSDAYTKAQYDLLGIQSGLANQRQGLNQTRKVRKLMPDGTYQLVDEPFKKGGVAKSRRSLHNTAVVEQALNKVNAPLPALDLPLMAAKAGRRY